MYIIVTTNEELIELAKKLGEKVIKDDQLRVKELNDAEDEKLEEYVSDFLYSLAIRPNYNGYRYLKYILKKAIKDKKYLNQSICHRIYPDCAKYFESTTSGVERSIRHVIRLSYEAVPEKHEAIYKSKLNSFPTNASFLCVAADYMRSEIKANNTVK